MVSYSKRNEEHSQESSDKEKRVLILHDDDENTFDHVIDVLCEICEHDAIQAEQCAFITHNNGECQIKIGTFDELLPIKAQLLENKLSVTID